MIDDPELCALFRAESEEHLETLDHGLLRLETQPARAGMVGEGRLHHFHVAEIVAGDGLAQIARRCAGRLIRPNPAVRADRRRALACCAFRATRRATPNSQLPSMCGLRTFDGAGNISGPATVNAGGTIAQNVRAPGVYTVNADCTGTMTNAGTRHYDLFIAVDGSQAVGIRTDLGLVEILSFNRVSRNSDD